MSSSLAFNKYQKKKINPNMIIVGLLFGKIKIT